MKKVIDWIEKILIAFTFVFLLFGGMGLSNFNAFAKRKITYHIKNVNFNPSGCSPYHCCRNGDNCEMEIVVEIPK